MRPIFCFILVVAGCGALQAQTNPAPQPETPDSPAAPLEETEAAATPPAEPESPPAAALVETHIYSDSVELGVKSRSAVYRGNVRLEDPRLHLTCEQLSADVPEEGSQVEYVVAETNVVIVALDDKGKTNRAYADKAVYSYRVTDTGTNEVVELTGETSPRIENDEVILYGDTIVWDRVSNKIRATNQRMIYRGDSSGSLPATSPPPTNASAPDALPDASLPPTAQSPGNNLEEEATDE